LEKDVSKGGSRKPIMPNIWTHLLFGHEVLKRAVKEEWLEGKTERSLFHLGCQGPDPLFYHHFWPWKKDKRMNRLGETMHEECCGLFIMDMLRHVEGSGCKAPALVYASGFLLHHILDRHAHPYVFAKSGFKRWNHQRFEIILDTIVAQKFGQTETWRTPVWRELWQEEGLPREVIRLLDALCTEHYPDDYEGLGPRQWEETYGDMMTALKLFHDPSGIKRLLTGGQIEPFVYKRTPAKLDYCNEARSEWRDPVDNQWIRTTSFWDHWEEALLEGEQLLRLALEFVGGAEGSCGAPGHGTRAAEAEMELVRRLGNVSYSTGRACGQFEIRYADPLI
jgi:hypothetical protein